jgi:hypothetical protein
MKKYTIGIVLIVLLLTACIPQISADPAENESDLRITGMVTSLGGEPDNFEQGIFNYTVTITNNSGQQKTITGVEPILAEQAAARLQGTSEQAVDLEIEPHGYGSVSGTLQFNFEGLSKADIEAFGPLVEGFRVDTHSVLAVP